MLAVLAATVFGTEFRRKTPYAELLPSWADVRQHPLQGLRRAYDVYLMDAAYHSAQVATRRAREAEDVRKRKAYRVAHGLEDPDQGARRPAQGLEDVRFGDKAVQDPRLAEEIEFEKKLKEAYFDSVEKAGGDRRLAEERVRRSGLPREGRKWFGVLGSGGASEA